MIFSVLGLMLAMFFGVFWGSEGELPAELQRDIFFGLIIAGFVLHALLIALEEMCAHLHCHCTLCRLP